MAGISDALKEFFDTLSDESLEDAAIEYTVRELHKGRRLAEILQDPFVRNRLNQERVDHMLESPELIEAVEEEVTASFKSPDLGFSS